MRAVLYRQPFEVAVGEAPDPRTERPDGAIVRIAAKARQIGAAAVDFSRGDPVAEAPSPYQELDQRTRATPTPSANPMSPDRHVA